MEAREGLGKHRVVLFTVVLVGTIGVAFFFSEYSFQVGSLGANEISSSFSISIGRPSPAYYATGDVIKIEFNVTDYNVGNLTISSPNQCVFGFRIRVTDPAGPVVYDSAKHANCLGPPFKMTLVPGENFTAGLEWNQLNDNGVQVSYGRYEVMGYYAGSSNPLVSTGEIVAGVVYFGKPVPVTPQGFLQNHYVPLSTDGATYPPGKTVRIDEGVVNNGPNIDSLMTSARSFDYQIFNLTNALVFDSLRHELCTGSLVDNPVVPQGGLLRSSYWNQTSDSGAAVPLGLYYIVEHARLFSGGRELNATKRLDIFIGSASSSGEEIIILSSSICALYSGQFTQSSNSINSSGCLGSGPSLSANLRVQGGLRSIQLFLDGVNISTRNYTGQCCQTSTDLPFETPIDNSTVPVFRGGAYDIVFVAAFTDGKTSVSWANPLLPWGGVP